MLVLDMDMQVPRVVAVAERGGRAWQWEGLMRRGDHQGPMEIRLRMTRYLLVIGVSDDFLL